MARGTHGREDGPPGRSARREMSPGTSRSLRAGVPEGGRSKDDPSVETCGRWVIRFGSRTLGRSATRARGSHHDFLRVEDAYDRARAVWTRSVA